MSSINSYTYITVHKWSSKIMKFLSVYTVPVLFSLAYIFLPVTIVAKTNCNIEVPQEGRNEPKYVGMKGYACVGPRWTPNDSKVLPSTPWNVPLVVQVGPELYEESRTKTIEHKTPVIVLSQTLRHTGHGFYRGYLTVKIIETSEIIEIRPKNFTPVKYWECPASKAIRYSSFIAKVPENILPLGRDGRWTTMGKENRVLCFDDLTVTTSSVKGIECFLYKQHRYDYGGARFVFPPSSLEIIY